MLISACVTPDATNAEIATNRDLREEVAQVAQIFGRVNTLSGYVGTGSVSAEFSTPASEP